VSALVVEKHHPMRSVLRGILRELGLKKIDDVVSTESGFEEFNKKEPDIVLVDWALNFDGIGLLNKIRTDTNSRNPFVPVIMVTAHSEVDRVIEARDASMIEYLAKPEFAKKLYQRISSIVDSKRQFIRIAEFFGPDRRRNILGHAGDDRRGNSNGSKYAAEG